MATTGKRPVGPEQPEPPPRESLPDKLLHSYAGIAAFVAGALYVAGVTTVAVRLGEAGLNSADFVPLWSLDQLLRTGLTWLSPALAPLVAMAVVAAASVMFERRLDRRAGTLENELAAILEVGEDRETRLAELRRLRACGDWSSVKREVSDAIVAREGDDATRGLKHLRRRLRYFDAWLYATGGGLAVLMAFLPPLLFLAATVLILAAGFAIGNRRVHQALAVAFAIVASAFVASAILYPRPLPKAIVFTQANPAGEVGDFVASSDKAWYIGKGRGRVLVIPADAIVCSRLQSRPAADASWRYLFEARQRERELDASRCAPRPAASRRGAGP